MNQALQDLIEHRRTTNVFEPNHTISDEQIEHLVHLATRAPTSFNLQNWRFLAVRTPERKAKLRKLAYDQAKVSDAAVTFIVIGQLADYSALEGRLAPSVDAGFMSPKLVAGSDAGRVVQKDLDIAEYTDPANNPMIPHVIVLEPGLIIHKIYNGYWFFGRPTMEDLRQDLRAVTKKCRPDWDITTPEMRAAWKEGRKEHFYPYGKTYAQT